MDEKELLALIIGAGFFALILWPWFKLRVVRRDLKNSRKGLEAAQQAYTTELTRLTEDLKIQTRNFRATIKTQAREHSRELKALNDKADRLAGELAGARKELGDARQEVESLKSQVGYAPGLAARIRHDIPKRLNRLWLFLESRLQGTSETERAFLKEELDMVVHKIELHLVSEDNLQKFVATTLETVTKQQQDDSARAPPFVSLTQHLRWLVDSNLWKQVDFEDMAACRMRGLWMHWDLMLTNILSNADYYSNQVQNGRISISTRMTANDRVEIDITNDGPLVRSHVRDHIYRLGFTTKEGGRGLGLTIAREIARGLGGDILPPENLGRFVGRSRVRFRLVGLPVISGDG